MKHTIVFPLVHHPINPDLITGDAMTRFVQAAERAGFDGVALTDHPAPSHKWLKAGGHDALDPFAVLSFIAAVTERLRLIPHVLVLPYRNPFVVAKSAATLDALSGGRFVLSVATGYLRSEYRALGVDFERRNELFDEALDVLRGVWSTDEFSYDASDFVADRVTVNPKPAHIPIWIGGNSALTRRRVARCGDGWNPFLASGQLAQTARTQPPAIAGRSFPPSRRCRRRPAARLLLSDLLRHLPAQRTCQRTPVLVQLGKGARASPPVK
jgi:probable F420-dependent oxidoreductase